MREEQYQKARFSIWVRLAGRMRPKSEESLKERAFRVVVASGVTHCPGRAAGKTIRVAAALF
jgi:hypothetical protein